MLALSMGGGEKKQASSSMLACTKCLKKVPQESLSEDKQTCPDCRHTYINVKCLYCCAEFECDNNDSQKCSLCKNCTHNEKHFGKPKACEWCSLLAAFKKSPLCQRCKHYQKKYGDPVPCYNCKKDCAFDRNAGVGRTDPNKDDLHSSTSKGSSKVLCWVCMQTVKKSKLKSDANGGGGGGGGSTGQMKRKNSLSNSSSPKKYSRSSNNNNEVPMSPSDILTSSPVEGAIQGKTMANRGEPPTENFLKISELNDKIAQLERQLSAKETQVIAKDRTIAELRAEASVTEKDLRTRLSALQRQNLELQESLANKSREVASLNKQLKDKKDRKT